MKTADDILKMIQFDLKHHRRLSEDSLEAISQFKADGRGEENDGFVWICPGDGYWSINGHISFITGGKEFGFNKGPTIFRVTHESSPLKPISESEAKVEELCPTCNKAKDVYPCYCSNAFHVMPISESKGETGQLCNEAIEQAKTMFCQIMEYQMNYVQLARTTEPYKLAEKGLLLLSSLRSSEPEREGKITHTGWEYEFRQWFEGKVGMDTHEKQCAMVEMRNVLHLLSKGEYQPSPPLKPLSEITDEDAVEIAKLLVDDHISLSKESLAEYGKDRIKNINTAYSGEHYMYQFFSVLQFLQHKGYAVPVFYPIPSVKEKGDKNDT